MTIKNADRKATKKAVVITPKHLGARGARRNISDRLVPGFMLRTSPDVFYFQFLNKGTGKREWFKIGEPTAERTVEAARSEARGLAGLVDQDGDLRKIRAQQAQQITANGVSFSKLHDAYIADCKREIPRPWGKVPQKESWEQIEYAMTRPLEWWAKRPANSITKHDIKKLYDSYVDDGYIPQANRVRVMLHTMFKWGIVEKEWLDINPCANPKQSMRLEAPSAREDGRVLTANELRAFWHGVDDPKCPGDRLSHLALKLSLVTALRTGEIVKIERTGVLPSTLTIPLKAVKSRRWKTARAVVQPLNSLAREILGEIFSIGDPERQYAFPESPNVRKKRGHMEQRSLGSLLRRRSTEKNGRTGLCEYLGLEDVTPHDFRRTAATILEQLGYDDSLIGKVLTHTAVAKGASPTTRGHYLVPIQIIERPVDKRIEALDKLDWALREILDLPIKKKLPKPLKLLTAA